MTSSAHAPVMLEQCIEQLNIKPGGCYVDCTFGRGGHSTGILEHLNGNGRVIAIDRDPQAIEFGRRNIPDPRVTFRHAKFSQLEHIADELQIDRNIDGILVDLGVSSPQLDTAERGFSFQQDGPLDMRMDTSTGQPAADWLARAKEEEIIECLREFGEERHAKRVARFIVEDRETEPIETTLQLAALVKRAIPRANRQRIHPATRTFQALRILVNQELEEITKLLEQAVRLLAEGGRMVVIAFHSLEDRIVKRFFRDISRETSLQQPLDNRRFQLPFRKPLRPDESEERTNARARSARLRVIERTA